MHDMSSTVMYRQLFASESTLNKYGHSETEGHDHVHQIHGHPTYKDWPLTVDNFATISYLSRQSELFNNPNQICLVPLIHKLMDTNMASEIIHQSRYTSIPSNMASERKYSDFLRDQEQHELLKKYKSLEALPLRSNMFYQRLSEKDNLSPDQRAAIRPTAGGFVSSNLLSGKQSKILSLASPSRGAEALCLSSGLPSSGPLAPHPSSFDHHQPSAGSRSSWKPSYSQQKMVTSSDHIPRTSLPHADVALLEELAFGRAQAASLPGALSSAAATSPPFWNPSLPTFHHSSPFLPMKRLPSSFSSYASPASHHAAASSFDATQHHHHLNQHHLVTEPHSTNASFGIYDDSRPSPGKHLLTNALKQSRVRHRYELSGALVAEKEHTQHLSCYNKSAIAQTQLSLSSKEVARPTMPMPFSMFDALSRGTHQSISAPGHAYPQPMHSLPPPPPLLRYFDYTAHYPSTATTNLQQAPLVTQILKSSPRITHPLSSHTTSSPNGSHPPPFTLLSHPDSQKMPLNLSISGDSSKLSITPPNSTMSSPFGPSPPITDCARWGEESMDPSHTRLIRRTIAAEVSNQAIDEHFRRSLGKSYDESPTHKTVTVHFQDKKHSVDDHFARALGDQMWTKIKDRSEPTPREALTSAVDSHFSKALGASMWKKLNMEHKSADSISPGQENQHMLRSSDPKANHLKPGKSASNPVLLS